MGRNGGRARHELGVRRYLKLCLLQGYKLKICFRGHMAQVVGYDGRHFSIQGSDAMGFWVRKINIYSFRSEVINVFGGMMSQGADIVARIER